MDKVCIKDATEELHTVKSVLEDACTFIDAVKFVLNEIRNVLE